MSTRNRVPPALEPYLRLPPETSLVLLTGTLECSANWLTALFVGNILSPGLGSHVSQAGKNAVILVSWMRDESFWKEEIKRTMGLDFSRLAEQGSFAFVDCLRLTLSTHIDTGDVLNRAEKDIKETIANVPGFGERQVLLVLDNADVLLAMGASTARNLNDFVMRLRTLVPATIMCCSADSSLTSVSNSQNPGHALPIEVEMAAFLIQQAHQAHLVMGVRGISSGSAVDVSGQLRITMGCDHNAEDSIPLDLRELEVLYLVSRDGLVKAFGRGEWTT